MKSLMWLYNTTIQLPKKIIVSLENEAIPFGYYLLAFFFSIALRNFFESYSQETSNYFNKFSSDNLHISILHFHLFYIMTAMAIIGLLHYVTGSTLQQAARVVLPGFIILLLAPLLDLFFTQGHGTNMFYLDPHGHLGLFQLYLTYSGGFKGASLGQKIEIVIALIGCFTYFQVKHLNLFLSTFYTWIVYSIIFALGASPYLINWVLVQLGFEYNYSSITMVHFYLIGIFALALLLLYMGYKKIFMALLKDLRTLRMLHYQLMLVLGAALALTNNSIGIITQLHSPPDTIVNIILCCISIFFAGLFSIITNNISDTAIDQISNPHRPLVAHTIDMSTYSIIGYLSMAISLFYASLVSIKAFMLVSVTMAGYFFYSMPPFRFKRITLFSKLIISMNSIALIVLGYLLIQHNLYCFPKELFLIYLIGYTFSANFIDLKDVTGDRAGGIMTLPILLSERLSKLLIGTAFWLTYIAFYYVIQNRHVLPFLILGGGIQFYLINKHAYREWKILAFYNLSVLFLIIYLFTIKTSYSS